MMPLDDLINTLRRWDFTHGGPWNSHDRAVACMKQAADEIVKFRDLADKSTARLAEISEPGSIGAFAARDHWKAKAEEAEAEIRRYEAQVRDLEDDLNRAHITKLILADVLDAIKAECGEEALANVAKLAKSINRAREHNAEIDALQRFFDRSLTAGQRES